MIALIREILLHGGERMEKLIPSPYPPLRAHLEKMLVKVVSRARTIHLGPILGHKYRNMTTIVLWSDDRTDIDLQKD